MDAKEFILELIDVIVWPITILIIVLLLKSQIRTLMGQLKTFKFKGAEFNFEKEINDVKSQVREIAKNENIDRTIASFLNNKDENLKKLKELAELSPRGSILETWLDLEEIILEAGERNINGCTAAPSKIDKNSTHSRIMKDFYNRGFISDYYLELYNGLRKIRNKAVHVQEKELSEQVANDFIDMAFQLKDKLKNI